MKELNYISGFEEALDYMSDKLNLSLKRHEPCLSSDYKDVVNDMIIMIYELNLRLRKIKEDEESPLGFGEVDLFKDEEDNMTPECVEEDDEEEPEWVLELMTLAGSLIPDDVDEITHKFERRKKEED